MAGQELICNGPKRPQGGLAVGGWAGGLVGSEVSSVFCDGRRTVCLALFPVFLLETFCDADFKWDILIQLVATLSMKPTNLRALPGSDSCAEAVGPRVFDHGHSPQPAARQDPWP